MTKLAQQPQDHNTNKALQSGNNSRTFSWIGLCLLTYMAGQLTLTGCKRTNSSNPVSTAEVQNERPQPVVSAEGQPDTSAAPEAKIIPKWAAKKYSYKPSRTLHWDLQHTKIDIRFDWAKREAPAIATLRLSPWFYPQDSLTLDAVGFDVRSVKTILGKKKRKLKFSYDSTQLHIALDSTYRKGQILTLEIDYTARPETVKEGGSAAITSDKGLYFINADGKDPDKPKQIWTQGETQASSHWFPTIDSPNERCTQEMVITVDTAYNTLSNGLLSYSTLNRDGTRTDTWEMKQPHAPYLFMMAIGKFVITKDKWRNKPLSYYVEPKYAAKTKNIFGRTPQMLEFFSKKLGVDYPWPKYDQVIVREFVSGAMENTSASLFMEALQVDDKVADGENWDDIVAHELFHQWFGDLVTTESWPNLPLNESFATFGELLWDEHTKGQDALDYTRLKKLSEYLGEAQTKQEPLIRYHVRDREDMFDSHSYAKGGLILQMLRTVVGEEAFFASLKLYLTRNQYKSVEIHDLRLAFEEVTGQDLHWFFDQWFMSAGHPRVAIQHYAKGNTVVLQVTQEQDTLYTPVYRLPLDVELFMPDGTKLTKHIVVDKRDQEWTWDVPAEPKLILFDAQNTTIGILNHLKTKKEFIFQLANAKRLIHRIDAVRQLRNDLADAEVQTAMLSALKDPFYAVRELAIGYIMQDSLTRIKALPTLLAMAKDDPSTNVRAEILSRLKPANAIEKQALDAGVKDSSPRVRSHAIQAMLEAGGPAAETLAQSLKTSADQDILLLVMQTLSEKGDPAEYDFMINTVTKMTGQNQYYAINTLGKYFLRCTTCQTKGIEYLTNAAKGPNALARLGAFQALGMLDEQPGVHETLIEIKKNETDPRVKEYFDLMLPE